MAPGRQGRVLSWMHRHREDAPGCTAETFEPAAVQRAVRRLEPLFSEHLSWFRPDVRGFEQVPPRPALVVSNHSGGIDIPDVCGFLCSWYRYFGVERPLHILAHELLFAADRFGGPLGRLGAVRADRNVALTVLRDWRRDLLVMPGGDREVYRPWRRRYQVDFAGRSGYARLAIRAGVPLVPVAHAGAHDTLFVLTDGAWIAQRMGLPGAFRASIFPISLALPWGLTIGPWPHLPLPYKLRYRVGQPIWPPPWPDPEEEPPEELVRDLDGAVRGAIQRQLDRLRARDPSDGPIRFLRGAFAR